MVLNTKSKMKGKTNIKAVHEFQLETPPSPDVFSLHKVDDTRSLNQKHGN